MVCNATAEFLGFLFETQCTTADIAITLLPAGKMAARSKASYIKILVKSEHFCANLRNT